MLRFQQQIADYAHANLRLLWQRQAMYAGGTVMGAVFVDPMVALLGYGLCQAAEWHDMRMCRRVLDEQANGRPHPARSLALLRRSSLLTAGAITFYILFITLVEGPGLHMAPLFLLLAAALYSTMNNCQVPLILRDRLCLYCGALIFIPLHDLAVVRPGFDSLLWMQLGNVLMLLFLIKECAAKFTANYRKVQTKMADLRVERDRVKRSYELQSQFVSIISHELRTPLTSIKASLDLITNEAASPSVPDIRRLARIGQTNSDRLAGLINDLLDFQKLEVGKMEYNFRMLDLRDLAQDAVEANRALGTERGIGFALDLGARPVLVEADPDRLMQVLTNILSNAVKFSDTDTSIELSVSQDDGQGRISVRDFGVGIPASAREQVFAPFTQVDASDKRAFGGTGLGMSISRHIVEAHGGEIDFVSSPGQGTTFHVTLGLREPEAVRERADDVMPITIDQSRVFSAS